MGNIKGPEEPKPQIFTVGFFIFALIVVFTTSVIITMLNLPYGLELVIYIYVGWNIRKFYFGSWQVIQTAALISLNNWLKKGKDDK